MMEWDQINNNLDHLDKRTTMTIQEVQKLSRELRHYKSKMRRGQRSFCPRCQRIRKRKNWACKVCGYVAREDRRAVRRG